MSRILIWSPNYAPELTGIPPLVTAAAEWLVKSGHEVSVVTALPNYPDRRIFDGYRGRLSQIDTVNGVEVHRSWLRVRPGESFLDKGVYEASFAAFSTPSAIARMRDADAVVCLIPTIFSSALGALMARLGRRRFVVWVQDLVLAAAEAVAGLGTPQRCVLSVVRRVESLPLRCAETVVTCSGGFIPYLRDRGAKFEAIEVIPNWVDVSEIVPLPEPSPDLNVRFLYTGNIGYTQGFETLLQAARQVGGEVAVEIVGGGNAADHVRRLMEGVGVVRPSVGRDEYPDLLGSAHALVVVQRRVAANANLPSKIASYLAAGRPIVASIDPETPAAEMLRACGGALVVPPEDPVALADAMRQLRDDADLRRRLGANGRRYAETNLAKDRILVRLEHAFLGA
jgi:putative colanic acid biosynthesis glycosyltransferase WcaI